MTKFVCINGSFGYLPDNIESYDTFKEAEEELKEFLNRLQDDSEQDCTIKKYQDEKDYLLAEIKCNSEHGHGAQYIEVTQGEE